MKKIIFIFLFFTQLFSQAQTKKVVGYLPTYKFGSNNSISYCKITHLNICFANPDSDGSLRIEDFSAIVKMAKEQNPNIIICISLGGGVISETVRQTWKNIVDIPSNRPAFISKIIHFVHSNNLDGVDFDLEWDAVTAGYSDFVIELKDSLQNLEDQSNIFGFSYATMVNTNLLNADVDQVGNAFYNGRPTIERKVEFSSKNNGGIMKN